MRLALVLALWGAATATARAESPAQPASTRPFLVHTNDVLGEIEPCGCRSNPMGGFARQANFEARHPGGDLTKNSLHLDAGDLLFATLPVPPLLQEQARLQASYVLEAMDRLHYDAAVPGEKDFALGAAIFDRLRRQRKIHFLAANLHKKGGAYLEPYRIFTFREGSKKLRVAVIGLVGEELAWPRELHATSAIATARKLVPALRKQADLVIALTHQGFDADKKLAERVAGIDLIVGGHSQSFLQEPVRVKNTLLLQSSYRNQYVGALLLTRQLAPQNYELIGLDAGYDSPEGKPSAMDQLVSRFKAAIAKLNSQGPVEAPAPAENGQNTKTGARYQTFVRCAECHVKQFDFWRKTPHALALRPLVKAQQSVNKECLTCHTTGLGAPGGFTDVTRLAELKADLENDSTNDPGKATPSLPFRTEELNQFLIELHDLKSVNDPVKLTPRSAELPLLKNLNRLTRAWTPVQCENCHQVGGDHPFSGTYSRKVEKNTCLACHNAERAPDWYSKEGKRNDVPMGALIDAKMRSVTCPAGNE